MTTTTAITTTIVTKRRCPARPIGRGIPCPPCFQPNGSFVGAPLSPAPPHSAFPAISKSHRRNSSPRLRAFLLPAHPALRESQPDQHGRHPDRRADAFPHRAAELGGEPLRLHLHRALGDALRDDDVGAVLLDQGARRRKERCHHLL